MIVRIQALGDSIYLMFFTDYPGGGNRVYISKRIKVTLSYRVNIAAEVCCYNVADFRWLNIGLYNLCIPVKGQRMEGNGN